MAKYAFTNVSVFIVDEDEDDDGNVTPPLQFLVMGTTPVPIADTLSSSQEPLLASQNNRHQDKRKGLPLRRAKLVGRRGRRSTQLMRVLPKLVKLIFMCTVKNLSRSDKFKSGVEQFVENKC
ncbi:hypothetical protein Fot_19621 [Forsythia ovata]|uniref:Uncharacterized protein n=1 Tax=Forsythia ovata TaxID=205694 RepID=A0ABD1VLJ8_9LAMI